LHASGDVHLPPAQHACPLPPHAPQLVPQLVPLGHEAHNVPPVPHAFWLLPLSHVDPLQHPLHDVPSHTHRPSSHRCPAPHVPLAQTPPHPSLAPHALPAQLGSQPQTPDLPPPPHVSGGAHAPPPQHACPLPPHVPQLTPHCVPLAHAAHATPPAPHPCWAAPLSQLAPLQQPLHDVGSHAHTPDTQCCPVPQPPSVHTPAQPSLSPHALPVQLAVHAPTPHAFGMPPPPHACPMSHPPQSTSTPHASISPQCPAHVSATVAHALSAAGASNAVTSAPPSMT
jgi:hypothetical protein